MTEGPLCETSCLKEIEPAQGANQNIGDGADPKVPTRKDVASKAGMSERQRKTALRVANIPKEEFEQAVESDNPPTVTALAERGKTKSTIHLNGRSPEDFREALTTDRLRASPGSAPSRASEGQPQVGAVLGSLAASVLVNGGWSPSCRFQTLYSGGSKSFR